MCGGQQSGCSQAWRWLLVPKDDRTPVPVRLPAPGAAAGIGKLRMAIEPFNDAASEGDGFRIGPSLTAIELGDAGAVAEPDAPQSSTVRSPSAAVSRATMPVLWRRMASSTRGAASRSASRIRSAPSTPSRMPLASVMRIVSVALISASSSESRLISPALIAVGSPKA